LQWPRLRPWISFEPLDLPRYFGANDEEGLAVLLRHLGWMICDASPSQTREAFGRDAASSTNTQPLRGSRGVAVTVLSSDRARRRAPAWSGRVLVWLPAPGTAVASLRGVG
jgi:hypothetical protein